jgi:NADPH:quinone reductase-like Zn-dependent oxidoreductase
MAFGELLDVAADRIVRGGFATTIDRTFELRDIQRAVVRQESATRRGKVLLVSHRAPTA